MSDSTLRASALLSERREIVGWEAGVRLGARGGGAEETRITSSPSPPEEEDGVRSKNAASSVGRNNTVKQSTELYLATTET